METEKHVVRILFILVLEIRNTRNMQDILLVDLTGTGHLRELGRDGRIILELILNQSPIILSNWFR
jgi:hypothetical protein